MSDPEITVGDCEECGIPKVHRDGDCVGCNTHVEHRDDGTYFVDETTGEEYSIPSFDEQELVHPDEE